MGVFQFLNLYFIFCTLMNFLFYTVREGFPLFGDYSLLSEICGNVTLVTSTLLFVLLVLPIPSLQFLNDANKKLFKCNKSVRRTCSQVNVLKTLLMDLVVNSVNEKKIPAEKIDKLFLIF